MLKTELVGESKTSKLDLTPVFVRCTIVGPDGVSRPGWEARIGNRSYGKADSREHLEISIARMQARPASYHWKVIYRSDSITHIPPAKKRKKFA